MAIDTTREGKLEWLLKPLNLAFGLSWFSALFGLTYFGFGLADDRYVIWALVAALVVNAGLTLWGISRLSNAAQGRL